MPHIQINKVLSSANAFYTYFYSVSTRLPSQRFQLYSLHCFEVFPHVAATIFQSIFNAMHPYFNLVINFFSFNIFSINVFNCFACCCTFHNRVCGTLRYEIIFAFTFNELLASSAQPSSPPQRPPPTAAPLSPFGIYDFVLSYFL